MFVCDNLELKLSAIKCLCIYIQILYQFYLIVNTNKQTNIQNIRKLTAQKKAHAFAPAKGLGKQFKEFYPKKRTLCLYYISQVKIWPDRRDTNEKHC